MKDLPLTDKAVHYPPQPTVRPATQQEVRDGTAVRARDAYRQAPLARPAESMTMSTAWVVIVPPDYPAHEYTPGVMWPSRSVRELCRVCRGTHTGPGDKEDTGIYKRCRAPGATDTDLCPVCRGTHRGPSPSPSALDLA